MRVEILGGPDDGEVVIVPEGAVCLPRTVVLPDPPTFFRKPPSRTRAHLLRIEHWPDRALPVAVWREPSDETTPTTTEETS
ncbi:hypothetical protein [Antribacter gilvus]|uniref:hypothetical protein n=1 Tax=Antribacter gilvus TaxID=2304675 RepID=UPI000F7A570F|nr:hypothetical protein [Antribacter gilvus]